MHAKKHILIRMNMQANNINIAEHQKYITIVSILTGT